MGQSRMQISASIGSNFYANLHPAGFSVALLCEKRVVRVVFYLKV